MIQAVVSDGSMHKHFSTSLFADNAHSNVLGEADFLAPPEGIYAFSLELTLTDGGNTHVSDPVWVVFNNGLTEEQHEQAIAAVPEPAGLSLLAISVLRDPQASPRRLGRLRARACAGFCAALARRYPGSVL